MSAPALPCPACGSPVLGGYTLVSGRGILLDPPLDFFEGRGFSLADNGMASPTAGLGRTEHRCEGGFDVVVTVLRGVATVRACHPEAEKRAKKALGGRLAGPVEALPVVLGRLRTAGLSVHHTSTTSGG